MKRLARTALWRTQMQILLWRHGWLWPIVFALAVTAALAHWVVLRPARAALAQTQTELAQEQAATRTLTARLEPISEKQQLVALQAALGSADPIRLVGQMAVLAKAEQINLQQGDYQQQVHATTQVIQVHVTQPVRASYPQLRRYIESVLRTIPNASLEQVAARRENVGQSQLEVRLRWSLWIQPAAADDAARSAR